MNYLNRHLYFTGSEICTILGISRQNLFRHVKTLGLSSFLFNYYNCKRFVYDFWDLVRIAYRVNNDASRSFIEDFERNVRHAQRLAYGAGAMRKETYKSYLRHPDPPYYERESWLASDPHVLDVE